MSISTAREKARQLAKDYIAQNKPLDWFEALYVSAAGDETQIAWADMQPNPNLTTWLDAKQPFTHGKSALVVGCGLGDDAEHLARLGFSVTAFDISPTAIAWCKKRFDPSTVQYTVHDVLHLPAAWTSGFDFIFEAYTLQVLPEALRPRAMQQIASCLAQDDTLLIVARGREPGEDKGTMPWPLTRNELHAFREYGLQESRFEDYMDNDTRRFRVEYRK
jgi:SAM-dependent methyltransferase